MVGSIGWDITADSRFRGLKVVCFWSMGCKNFDRCASANTRPRLSTTGCGKRCSITGLSETVDCARRAPIRTVAPLNSTEPQPVFARLRIAKVSRRLGDEWRMTNAEQAIKQSRDTNSIVHVHVRTNDIDENELLVECIDSADNGSVTEYWGTDWRVHVHH